MRVTVALTLLCWVLSTLASAAQIGDAERKIRNVTPENIPVIILPPRKQDNNATAKPNEPPISGDGVIARLSEEGIVTADGKTLHFAGVTMLPNDTLCENDSGTRSACGLRAFVALRNFVHGKEIKCEALSFSHVRCFRERIDISEWILGEGWALYDESAKDQLLARAAEDARTKARGIWANGSRPVKR